MNKSERRRFAEESNNMSNEHIQAIIRYASMIPILLAACGPGPDEDVPPDDGWYRASHLAVLYDIVRADIDDDSCLQLKIAPTDPDVAVPDELRNVEVLGADATLYAAVRGEPAHDCATDWPPSGTPPEHASGTIRLRDFVTTPEGESHACTIDIDLVFDDTLFRRDGIPVWGPACPRPTGELETLVGVEAAYSQQDQELTIVGWDSTRETCTWVLFRTSATPSRGWDVEVPTNWYRTSARMAPMARDACDASTIWEHEPRGVGNSVNLLDFEGAVSFLTSTPGVAEGYEFEIPCSLQVDMVIQTNETYFWVANQLELRGANVDVAGACE